MTQAIDAPPPPSAEAKKLAGLREKFDTLKIQGPVRIDAYISSEVPESYVQTRINLLNVLREFKILGGDMVELQINDMTHADPMADVAKTRFNIVPKEVIDNRGGAYKRDSIFMGVAFTCGLEKVVLPFVERGLPAEYELVRSLCTVTRQKRKRIGVLETDAHVFGNFSQMGMSPPWQLIEELKKQYEVVSVSPADLAPGKAPDAKKRYERPAGDPALFHGPERNGRFRGHGAVGPADGDLRRPLLLPLLGAGSSRHVPAAAAARHDGRLRAGAA